MNNVQNEIDTILQKNSIEDLKKFINKRACLNNCNVLLTYIFHFLQTCGMITTALSVLGLIQSHHLSVYMKKPMKLFPIKCWKILNKLRLANIWTSQTK